MRRNLIAAALLGCAVATGAQAVPRFIGPWFIDATMNTATGSASLTAGQNTTRLGITFTCFDRHVTLGVWKPSGSLGLDLGRRTGATVQVDRYPVVELVGIATQRNVAEFDENVGLIMRQMLAGRQATLVFADQSGDRIEENFPLDNAAIAFGDIAQSCPLN